MGNSDHLEKNIERLLRSVEPELKLPEQYRHRTVNKLFAHGRSLASEFLVTTTRRSVLIRYWPGIAVLFIVVCFAVWFIFFNSGSDRRNFEIDGKSGIGTTKTDKKSSKNDDKEVDTETPPDKAEAEVKWVADMGEAGDIDALLGVLSDGSLLGKIAAAYYLGKLGDSSMIEDLERASAEWLGQDKDNPFLIAINQIESRIATEPEPVEEAAVGAEEPGVTTIEGYVYGETGEPASGVTFYCYDGRAFCIGDFGRRSAIASGVTDSSGFYRIEKVPEHLCFIERGDDQQDFGIVRRAVVPTEGKASRLDFGGESVFSGWIRYNEILFSDTRIFIGEAGNPRPTVFGGYTVTDPEGKYSFMGVPTGRYGVFFESPENPDEWIKVGAVEIGQKDLVDYGFDVSTADVFVSISFEDPNYLPGIADVLLYEGSDFDGMRAGFALAPAEAGEPYVFEGVMPGLYRIVAVSESGVFYSETFELPADIAEINISVDIAEARSSVDGVVEGYSGQLLVLWSSDKKVGAYVAPDSDGMYMAGPLPAGEYFLGYSELGMDRPLEQFVLGEDEQKILDVDVGGWLGSRTSLWVYVVDENGVPLTGASVTVQNSGLQPKDTTGAGAHFIVEPGEYTVGAQYGSYKQGSKKVQLAGSNVFGQPNDDQIVYVVLER